MIPGDYQVALGLFESTTGEHAVVRRELHVDALFHDPLPHAWQGLPAVEFLPAEDTPSSWYSPSVEGRLNLHIEAKRPLHIEVLLNGSPTEQPRTPLLRASRAGTAAMIPALKILSQIRLGNGVTRIVILDLERRRVGFEQTLARDLDWTSLKAALAEAGPDTIDVASLEKRRQEAQFFVSEVRQRALTGDAPEPPRVLIVLSGPMVFAKADLSPIRAIAGPNCKIFYIRFYSPVTRVSSPPMPDNLLGS